MLIISEKMEVISGHVSWCLKICVCLIFVASFFLVKRVLKHHPTNFTPKSQKGEIRRGHNSCLFLLLFVCKIVLLENTLFLLSGIVPGVILNKKKRISYCFWKLLSSSKMEVMLVMFEGLWKKCVCLVCVTSYCIS